MNCTVWLICTLETDVFAHLTVIAIILCISQTLEESLRLRHEHTSSANDTVSQQKDAEIFQLNAVVDRQRQDILELKQSAMSLEEEKKGNVIRPTTKA